MPPQLRMFMRTTFMPARQALLPVPITYCESLEPSRPCTMISVMAPARSVCQWQWHSTCTSGST